MQERGSRNPIIYSYLKRYQQNPRSRIFAPLAEAYRKSGLIEEAIEIAREGLQYHPRFIGGRVALARALFDKKDFQGVIEELRDIVQEVPDNLIAQRLYAESCLVIGRVADALTAYKLILYFHPQDQEVAQLVFELEAQSYNLGRLVLENEPSEEAPAKKLITQPLSRHLWMKKIEKLQSYLQRIERYRSRNVSAMYND